MGLIVENKLYQIAKEISNEYDLTEVFVLDVFYRYLKDIFHAIEHGEKVIIPKLAILHVIKKGSSPIKELDFKTRCKIVADELGVTYTDVEKVIRGYISKLKQQEDIEIPCVCYIQWKGDSSKNMTYTKVSPILKARLDFRYGEGKFKFHVKASESLKTR